MTPFILLVFLSSHIDAPSKRCYVWADVELEITKVYKVPLKFCIIWPREISASPI